MRGGETHVRNDVDDNTTSGGSLDETSVADHIAYRVDARRYAVLLVTLEVRRRSTRSPAVLGVEVSIEGTVVSREEYRGNSVEGK